MCKRLTRIIAIQSESVPQKNMNMDLLQYINDHEDI